ncbi:MAG: SET domain-containing protein-lysine N-methyltransferase [Opitutales bacterium]|nr:SET domain-containing protein-lysine N-methyltransferase [Opitutales bacterium]
MQWSAEAFRVGPSTIPGAGKGLFALQRIAVGDTIGYYTGEVVSAGDLNAGRFAKSEYLLYVTRNHILVGEGPKANYTRYINHSEQANAFLVTSTRWKTARFEAIREIHPGDEVFFDYGECFF